MIVTVLLLLLFAPLLATHDPNAINLVRLLAPSAAHWFGTDEVGRDMFSRVIYGGQLSVGVGVFVVAVAGIIGTCWAAFPASWAARLTR